MDTDFKRPLLALLIFSVVPISAFCQQSDPSPNAVTQNNQNAVTDDENSKRIFWIIPNFRTTAALAEYKPISPREKFRIAAQDAFDRGTFALAALFAGEAQLSNSNRSFGQGVEGYGKYFGTAYGDYLIGDYLTEGIYPTLLHQDPRYFRRGKGKFMSRLAYSAGQIFLTHGDSGHTQVNFSELLGNSTAVAISMAYYPDNRDVGDAVSKLGTQLGIDMVSNILKEFAPDLTRKFSHKHQ